MRTSQSTFARCGVRVSQRPLTLALALALGLGSPLAGLAATISVITPDDAGSATDCTLRQAIVSMNAGSLSGTGCVNSGGDFGTNDTINFAPPAFPQFEPRTITLADVPGNQLAISDTDLTITAGAYAHVTIQRSRPSTDHTNQFGIINDTAPAGGSLTLNHLTVSNGGMYVTHNCNSRSGGGGICMTAADLTLNGSAVSGNYGYQFGGGILSLSGNVTLNNSTVSNNLTHFVGGGIYVTDKNLTLNNSTLSGNSANRPGYCYGGGIVSHAANITLTNSTISGNSASYVGGIISDSGNVTLTNSTLSGNAGTGGAFREVWNAGGIRVASGNVTLTNSTISGNSAGSYNGGISLYSNSPTNVVQVINSIVAGNSAPDGETNASLAAGSTNNIVGGDPKLAALAGNGGPTQTMLPLADSPAIDGGSDADCPVTDQRGVKRPQGAHCDIGAVEVLTAQIASPDLLFTNWSSGIDFGGPLYTGGGDCSASCFAVADNFSNQERWLVTGFAFYLVTPNGVAYGGWRYALFNAAGDEIVAPTDAAPTFTDLGLFTGPYDGSFEVYQGVISDLSINLPPDEYQLRFTNTQQQSIYPAFGVSTSSQTVSPGFVQLTGSAGVEALLSTDVTQRSQEWAFDLFGTEGEAPIFKDGFEGP